MYRASCLSSIPLIGWDQRLFHWRHSRYPEGTPAVADYSLNVSVFGWLDNPRKWKRAVMGSIGATDMSVMFRGIARPRSLEVPPEHLRTLAALQTGNRSSTNESLIFVSQSSIELSSLSPLWKSRTSARWCSLQREFTFSADHGSSQA